jgi:hypothetical protein
MEILAATIENALAAILRQASLPGVNVYVSHHAGERINPCIVVAAQKQADDFRIKNDTRHGATVSVTLACRVHASLANCDQILDDMAARAVAAIEASAADDFAAFEYFQLLEPTEQYSTEEAFRILAHGWTATVLLA